MNTFTSTGTFVRFFLRREWFGLIWWTLGVTILYVSQAVSIDGLYATQAEFDRAAESMGNNPAFIAMAGPARALNTVGGQVAWQSSAFGAVLAGLMSMFIVGRHTRAEEETGRDELVRSGVVGRYAPVAAAVIVVVFANIVLGIGITASLLAYGLPTAGSLSLGVACTVTGLVFAAVALLAAQLTGSVRTMYGITGAVIAVSYVLRGIGDIGNPFWSWLSPIGWGQAMRAYADEIWWPALLALAVAVAVTVVAVRLLERRDIGSGLLPPRPGPARAGAGLGGSVGLAWRLQRGTLIGWSIGLFLTGLAYGSIGSDVGDLIGDSTQAAQMMAQASGDLVDSFYATTALMMALMSSGYAIQSALRLKAEEAGGRIEPLLGTALSRARLLGSHTLMSLAGSALVVGLGGLGVGLTYGVMIDDLGQVPRMLGASLVHLPATWVLAGVTVALLGLTPRFAVWAWAALGFCVVALFFGAVLDLPQWLLDVSPFTHMPLVPVEDPAYLPLLGALAVAVVLLTVGFVAFRRRDIRTT